MSNPPTYTTSQGCPITDAFSTQRISATQDFKSKTPIGPLLLQDFKLIDSLAHFDRERIPERVVHAKGAGAHGVFEVTDDITDICSAKFLDTVGKKTKIFTRFSTVGGEKGSSDSARDPREIQPNSHILFIPKRETQLLIVKMLICSGIT
ncbi:unnamed protein product [[Candida] boidinii]|nr:unnamed protein product [[Candida] boidinii]